ncbi:hypothetical protein GGI16_009195, partial [Coemansia sp. S142-1]
MPGHRLTRVIILVCSLLAFIGFYHVLQYVSRRPITTASDDMQGPWSNDKGQAMPLPISEYSVTSTEHSTGNTTLNSDDNTLLRAAMVALVRNSELDGIRSTIRQVDDRFN